MGFLSLLPFPPTGPDTIVHGYIMPLDLLETAPVWASQALSSPMWRDPCSLSHPHCQTYCWITNPGAQTLCVVMGGSEHHLQGLDFPPLCLYGT